MGCCLVRDMLLARNLGDEYGEFAGVWAIASRMVRMERTILS